MSGPRGFDVELLAALDLHGARGTALRRRLILVEFLIALLAGVPAGMVVVVLGAARGSWGTLLFGVWLAGACLNYLPLVVYAIQLRSPERLRERLRGVELGVQLRRYSVLQLWVVVPLSLVFLALRRSGHR